MLFLQSAFCWFLISATTSDSATSPNFLFIYADDVRWDAMGVVQQEQGESARFPWFQTPHLDRLAAEGLRFRNAMVATSVCSPSRAKFRSGFFYEYYLDNKFSETIPFTVTPYTNLLC